MRIYVKKTEGVVLPEKGTDVSAGYDIVATSDPKIVGKESTLGKCWARIDYIEYETNLFIAPEAKTFHTLIHPRSSISKYSLVLANSIGLVDNDYRGQLLCRFKYIIQPEDLVFGTDASGALTVCYGCVVPQDKIYKKGDRIAQVVAEPTVMVEWILKDDLTETARGTGGFGSTPDKIEKTEKVKTDGPQLTSIVDRFQKLSGTKPLPYTEQLKQREQL